MDISREHLEAFLEVAEHLSVQAASRATGRSRATYTRYLRDLRSAFEAPELLQRARGQRQGTLTPAGRELAVRAQALLARWSTWEVATRDALRGGQGALRVGALAGAFDLIADVLSAMRCEDPKLRMLVEEFGDDELLGAVASGKVDAGFGAGADRGRAGLRVHDLGPLSWALIVPSSQRDEYPARVRMADLAGRPLVVRRSGAARDHIERAFVEATGGPLEFVPAIAVASAPRVVDMVARGFGPAIVSRFRLAFLPDTVRVLPLVDGPAPLRAVAWTRRSQRESPLVDRLIAAARERFVGLAVAPQG